MKLNYDRELCQGHNRCYMLAPEIFDVDEEGYAVLKIVDEIPVDLQEKAQLCVDNCPEYAISIAED